MEFKYKAKNSRGKIITGLIDAPNKAEAKKRLAKNRLRIMSLGSAKKDSNAMLGGLLYKDENGNIQLGGGAPPKTKDIIMFTKQFSTLINSGVAMVQGLGILADQQKVRSFKLAINGIKNSIEDGKTLSDGMRNYKKIFDDLYIAMVEAGEASGQLDNILGDLIVYIEKAAKIKKQIFAAMMYPSFVMAAAFGVTGFLMVFVVPKFAEMFQGSGQELPGLTQITINISEFIQANALYMGGTMAVIVTILVTLRSTAGGRVYFDALTLKLPVVGDLLKKIAVGRFCQTLSTMLCSGVSILDALRICSASSGNKVVESLIDKIKEDITNGEAFAPSIGKHDLFPTMVVSMVDVGEKTGALDDMLKKISEFYEEEVDDAVHAMTAMIEPVMIIFLGGMVGFIVLSMFLPIFDMASTVG